MVFSPYLHFSREEWGRFRDNLPLTLQETDLQRLGSTHEKMSLDEVEKIYLPLSRLLSLYVRATQLLHEASCDFLGKPAPKVPYLIGVAGSVAVGKSTTSRVLQALLSRWPHHPKGSLVATDGFLYSLAELERRGLLSKKGFPESYDIQRLIQFLGAVKSGEPHIYAPVYSHHLYDILPNERLELEAPDIVIVEGLNILQTGAAESKTFVSDFFDFTIFVDADTCSIKQWFIDRVLQFKNTAFQDPSAYFHFIAKMTTEETIKFCQDIWRDINERNLRENILPYKNRARLILYKELDHTVQKVLLRKL
jgi:type I pantothenate kinase